MLPYQTVVCAIDLEAGSARALVRAADLAERAHAALHLVHVRPLFRARLAHASDAETAAPFERAVRAYVGRALGADDAFEVLDPVVREVHGAAASDGVLRYAREVGADLVVLGTHGRTGLDHVLLGSVAAETLRRSPVPVLVVPDRAAQTAPGPRRPVLVAADFSDHTAEAVAEGARFGHAFGAPLALAHVRDAPPDALVEAHPRRPFAGPTGLASRAEAREALRGVAEAAGLEAEAYVVPGRPADAIVALAGRTRAGLLVVGTHGRRGWDRLRLGSVAEGVARRAECPVLVVPTPALRRAAAALEASAAS